VGDKYGRRVGVWIGAVLCTIGGALQAASQNSDMFIVARVIAGLGIGFNSTIVPPWISELASSHNRGASFSLVFIANCKFRSICLRKRTGYFVWFRY
jgi:MFS family permease